MLKAIGIYEVIENEEKSKNLIKLHLRSRVL